MDSGASVEISTRGFRLGIALARFGPLLVGLLTLLLAGALLRLGMLSLAIAVVGLVLVAFGALLAFGPRPAVRLLAVDRSLGRHEAPELFALAGRATDFAAPSHAMSLGITRFGPTDAVVRDGEIQLVTGVIPASIIDPRSVLVALRFVAARAVLEESHGVGRARLAAAYPHHGTDQITGVNLWDGITHAVLVAAAAPLRRAIRRTAAEVEAAAIARAETPDLPTLATADTALEEASRLVDEFDISFLEPLRSGAHGVPDIEEGLRSFAEARTGRDMSRWPRLFPPGTEELWGLAGSETTWSSLLEPVYLPRVGHLAGTLQSILGFRRDIPRGQRRSLAGIVGGSIDTSAC